MQSQREEMGAEEKAKEEEKCAPGVRHPEGTPDEAASRAEGVQ